VSFLIGNALQLTADEKSTAMIALLTAGYSSAAMQQNSFWGFSKVCKAKICGY